MLGALLGLQRVDRLRPALEAGVGVDLRAVVDLVLDHHQATVATEAAGVKSARRVRGQNPCSGYGTVVVTGTTEPSAKVAVTV